MERVRLVLVMMLERRRGGSADEVRVDGGIIRPGHRQSLSLVLHSTILKPDLHTTHSTYYCYLCDTSTAVRLNVSTRTVCLLQAERNSTVTIREAA